MLERYADWIMRGGETWIGCDGALGSRLGLHFGNGAGGSGIDCGGEGGRANYEYQHRFPPVPEIATPR